jgi:hypothetical protein
MKFKCDPTKQISPGSALLHQALCYTTWHTRADLFLLPVTLHTKKTLPSSDSYVPVARLSASTNIVISCYIILCALISSRVTSKSRRLSVIIKLQNITRCARKFSWPISCHIVQYTSSSNALSAITQHTQLKKTPILFFAGYVKAINKIIRYSKILYIYIYICFCTCIYFRKLMSRKLVSFPHQNSAFWECYFT